MPTHRERTPKGLRDFYRLDRRVRGATRLLSGGLVAPEQPQAEELDVAIKAIRKSKYVRTTGLSVEKRSDEADLEVQLTTGKTFFIKLVQGNVELLSYLSRVAKNLEVSRDEAQSVLDEKQVLILDVRHYQGIKQCFEEELERWWTR